MLERHVYKQDEHGLVIKDQSAPNFFNFDSFEKIHFSLTFARLNSHKTSPLLLEMMKKSV